METTRRNLLIVVSSPRKMGNSAALAERAASAARANGAQIEIVTLQGLKIRPCTDCDLCRKVPGKFCTLQDDMQGLYPKLLNAHAVLLASPIYWFTFNAQLKAFLDRWYGLWKNERNFLRGKPVGIILTYGDTDETTSGAVNAIHTFESMFNYLGAPLAGVVHGSLSDPGDAEKNPAMLQAAYDLGKKLAQ